MGSRGGGGRGRGRRRAAENGGYWWVQPLKPLMEGPDLELMQDEFISNKEETLLITTTTTSSSSSSSNNNNNNSSSSWEVLREWFRVLQKNNNGIRPPNGNGFSIMSTLMYYSGGGGGGGGGIHHIRAKRQDLRLLLGVLGCPLAPIPLMPITTSFPILHRPQIIKDIPIETSTAHYIIEQYLAATGCIKQQRGGGGKSMMMIKNMYTTGTVKMICCETETSSSPSSPSSSSSSSSSSTSGKTGGGRRVKSIGSASRGENGCFVLWQMSPGMWSLELVVGNGTVCGGGRDKVVAGSDGKIVWRHTPWLGTHVAKGPHRPLRRIIQGLDPKSTAKLFGEAQCMGEKRIGEEDCFVLRVAADRAAVMERNEGPAEVIRHVLYGYFSQKTGLLRYLEDSHLTRVQPITPPPPANGNFYKCNKNNVSCNTNKETTTVYWETTIGSTIGDYREVDGVLIAHGGRTIVTIFRFGEQSSSTSTSASGYASMEHYHYSRTRMEEIWRIDDVVFNVPGLSLDSFIPPSDIV